MIIGAHTVLYSSNPEADRDFLKNILQLTHVDIGHGWLIFGLPPSEIAVHPADTNSPSELYLICDKIDAFIQQMSEAKIACEPIRRERWGHLTYLTLPGGGKLGVYEPLHPRPEPMR
ncbi:MAG TPA: hypothetical protein VI233_13220 [Puia sp.]